MSCPPRLWQWHQQVSSAFPQFSNPQTQGLAWWSAGIALTGSVGISQISALLALVLDQKEGTVSPRLREWYLEAQAKWGGPRRDLVVSTCFGPLLGWLIRLLGDAEHRLALALDATSARSSLDRPFGKCAGAGMRHSCRLEGASSTCQRLLASLLGRAAGALARPCVC